ncbi:MAG TPA: choice-of-anchor B family protein [Vicinamibacteria bacterium]|nr:choice-of-anchor B family protein [Vicinamibacteria bacterium]
MACALLAAACGGEAPSGPAPLPTPGSGTALTPPLNISLLAQVPLADLVSRPLTPTAGPPAGNLSAAGNWGYTSPAGRRFALTGTSYGLSVVEVTDPGRPRNVGYVPGPTSAWREVKTYGEYAYVTTEARHGLDIVDLSDPDRPRLARTWNRSFFSAHSLWIDEERGLLFANGTRDAAGDSSRTGMRVLDLGRDPEDPADLGGFTEYYVHDSYSAGDRLYASAISDGFLATLDVSNPRAVRELGRFFTGGRFTHNAWPTRDGRYLFTTDERPGRPVETWDLVDPLRPRKVSEYIAAPGTMPHNVMVDGDRLLVAHYTEGVHLLDVRNPERPALMGSYDTFPGTAAEFSGAWGAYIFPASDLIVVSDVQGGLFVLRSALR